MYTHPFLTMCAPKCVLHAAVQDAEEVRAVIPRRTSLLVDRGVLIVAFATHKQKSLFFFLVQACPFPGSPLAGNSSTCQVSSSPFRSLYAGPHTAVLCWRWHCTTMQGSSVLLNAEWE